MAPSKPDLSQPGASAPDLTQVPPFDQPSEYQPGSMVVSTAVLEALPDNPDAWRKAVEDLGLTVPEGWTIRLVEAKHDPAAWHRDHEAGKAVTRPVWRYKFAVEHDTAAAIRQVDEKLLAAALRAKAPKPVTGLALDAAYIIAIGDTQIGKVDLKGGTPEAVERLLACVDRAIQAYLAIPKADRPGTIALCLLGDHVEGMISQKGSLAWRTDLGVTDMVRVWRRLLMEIVRRLAATGVDIRVAGVTGNHDEAIREPVKTYANDSWAIEAMSAVADACAENPAAFNRVKFYFPEPERLDMTFEVGGTIIALAHGHQWKPAKAMEWWAGQAHGMQPAGHATILLSGHYHHLRVLCEGSKTHFQVPPMDGGSGWFRNLKGHDSDPGILALTVRDGGWSGYQIH